MFEATNGVQIQREIVDIAFTYVGLAVRTSPTTSLESALSTKAKLRQNITRKHRKDYTIIVVHYIARTFTVLVFKEVIYY